MPKLKKAISICIILIIIITPAGAMASGYTGTGEVWGDVSGQTYQTPSVNRFRVTTPGWYVKQYTVYHIDCYDLDSVGAVGMYYNNTWNWTSLAPNYKKVSGLPWTTSPGGNVTGLGLELRTHSGYPDTTRGLYFSQIILTDGTNEVAVNIGEPPPVEPDPEPPDALSIYLVDKGRDHIKIAWGASEGATGYKIYRNGAHVDTITGTNYTFTGLTPGTNYELKVKAYNNVGDSSFSNTLNVSTDPIPAPENFRVLDRGWYHIKTAWDPVSDVDGYKIYKNGSYIGTTTSTNYEFSGLSEASLYNLGVAAYKGAYQSEIKQMQASTQGVTSSDEIIQLLQSYLPDTCSQVKQIWQQVTKDLPVIATNINAITENTGSIKNDVKKLKDYITTPRIAPALQTDPMPSISFDSTLPDISEPGQDPYIYDRPDPVMPSPITSPGPLPYAPNPTIMPHDEPIPSAPPTQLDEPMMREDPRQQDPVIKEPPLIRDPVSMDPPLAQDPVFIDPPLARTPVSGVDPPLGREGPITADPPYTRTPPLTPAPPGG